jgi:hypothetical protein
MFVGSTSDFALVSEGINRLAEIEESPEPGYGLLAFARDLHAERCRLDQQALEAARQTLAQEGV